MSKKQKGETLNSLNKGFKVPDTYVIIFFVVCLAALMTYLIPQGMYQVEDITYMVDGTESTRTVIKDNSFQYALDDNGQPLKQGIKLFEAGGGVGLMNYLFEGMVSGDKSGSAIGVMAIILVCGGAFGIMMRTGAVETGIMALIRKANGKERLMIPVLFIFFSAGGAIWGMGEESIPFAMILVPMVVAMGYDGVTGVLITYVATQIGFATSWMNPFSVVIAQGVAGVPVMSGSTFRIVLWVVFTGVGLAMTMIHAERVRKTPTLSISYETDAYFRDDMNSAEENAEGQKLQLGHILVLLTLAATIVWVIWGVLTSGYYIPEISTQFFIMGVVAGIIGVVFKLNDMKLNDIATAFKQGAADLVGAALIVGMAMGIMLVLGGSDPSSPTVLNTILHGVSEAFSSLSGTFAAVLMYIFQAVFNFFVVSGSGQAALTMPIMAPLADLLDVTRQTAVLAFQLGDGLTNLIVPTSGCLMGALAVARIDWSQWIKFMWKFLGVLMLMSIATMIIASVMGF